MAHPALDTTVHECPDPTCPKNGRVVCLVCDDRGPPPRVLLCPCCGWPGYERYVALVPFALLLAISFFGFLSGNADSWAPILVVLTTFVAFAYRWDVAIRIQRGGNRHPPRREPARQPFS